MLGEEQRPQVPQQPGRERGQVGAGLGQLVEVDERPGGIAGGHQVDGGEQRPLIGGAQQGAHVLGSDSGAARGRELVERGHGGAEAAAGGAGDQRNGGVVQVDRLGGGDPT